MNDLTTYWHRLVASGLLLAAVTVFAAEAADPVEAEQGAGDEGEQVLPAGPQEQGQAAMADEQAQALLEAYAAELAGGPALQREAEPAGESLGDLQHRRQVADWELRLAELEEGGAERSLGDVAAAVLALREEIGAADELRTLAPRRLAGYEERLLLLGRAMLGRFEELPRPGTAEDEGPSGIGK